MAKRPIEAKQRRRVAKAIRRQPLPAFFDVVNYLVSRGHAKTRRQARQIILDKRVRSGSHTLGVVRVKVLDPKGEVVEKDIVDPRVSVDLQKELIVVDARDI